MTTIQRARNGGHARAQKLNGTRRHEIASAAARARHQIDPGAEALGDALNALVQGMGRGGLTYMAGKLGLTVSATRKRLLTPGAGMDAPTMRAVILINQSHAQVHQDVELLKSETVGEYVIETRIVDGQPKPLWRTKGADE